MSNRLHAQLVTVLLAAPILPGVAQTAMDLRGTIGQQAVQMTVEFNGDTIIAAHYRYESQRADIVLSESRLIGSTAILADADGNVFHLHLKRADGSGTSSLAQATAMSGQMDRDTLELPVEIKRVNTP